MPEKRPSAYITSADDAAADAAETLRTIAADPRHLGAEIGFVAVHHTWGQNLHHHPHVHCVVPGGGLSIDGSRCRPGFFLPVRVLSRLFRRLFLQYLQAASEAGDLRFSGSLAELAHPDAFAKRLAEARRIEWVVYAKPPFGGPQQMLAYLSRYTHRVAIANSHLVSIEDDRVSFHWKDYRHHDKTKAMSLDAFEFIRRFLLHTLPDGFHRIRHYGFLANGHRADKLSLCRKFLAVTPDTEPRPVTQDVHELHGSTISLRTCPCCGGTMITLGVTLPPKHAPSFWNSS